LLRIKELKIHGIGGIDDLTISFNGQFNIICGPNGIGKTTILECIGHSFSHHHSTFIRRNANYDQGYWRIATIIDNDLIDTQLDRNNFHPTENNNIPYHHHHLFQHANNVLVLKTNRHFDYIALNGITKDSPQDNHHLSIYGIQANDLKNWFVSRFMWAPHELGLSEVQKKNLETAKEIFGVLDDQIRFSRVKIETFDILVKNNSGAELYFEYLSSGYKSVIYILLGLMKEVEFRFKDEKQIQFQEYSGIIIIDELDLHLHPQWQSKLIQVLKTVFPNAQFIVSTHSPHMLQVAQSDEIIPLGYHEDGSVTVRKIASSKYGFQGWTVEEILTDVMGLKSVVSDVFTNSVSKFEEALNTDNIQQAQEAYSTLNNMLHPENQLRKILKIQMASMGDIND